MNFFKKNKTLLIVIIIICGIIVMWGRSFITGKGGTTARRGLFGRKLIEKAPEEAIPVRVTNVTRGDYRDVITSFGNIKGFAEIPIKFRETDRVLKFYFKEGDAIKSNDLIVSLEQEEQNAKLEYSEIDYNKNKILHELGAVIHNKVRQAELEVESARSEVEKRNFYAPSDGLMGTRKINEGELADPNSTVATFLDISSVFCEAGIIEKDMDKVKTGQKVKITLDTLPDDIFDGTVDSVSPMIEGRSRTQIIKILIPNEKSIIKPGMFAKAVVTIFEEKDAIVISKKALKKAESGYTVFAVVRDQGEPQITSAGFELATAKVIPVKVKRAREDLALIGEGLTEGQEIILESPRANAGIKDGGRIEIIGTE